MLGYRSNDAVLTICQNNVAKSIEIIDVNEAAASLTGYSKQELAGRALASVVPMRLSTLLIEYIEYEEDANDVGAVLSKVQSFSMLAKDGKEKNFRLKVVRGESTKEKLTFRLVLQDAIDVRKDDALHKLIQENFKGHEVLHPSLEIPDRHSLEKDVELTIYYHHKANIRASFVAIQLDHLESLEKQYNAAQSSEFLKHIVQVFRGNLRPGDVVGAISDTQIGVLLLDAVSDSTRLVANRLRWQVAAQPFSLPDTSMLSLTASMAYINIDGVLTADRLVDACLSKLAELPEDAASQLVEVAG